MGLKLRPSLARKNTNGIDVCKNSNVEDKMLFGIFNIFLLSAGVSVGYFFGSGKLLRSMLAFVVMGSILFTGSVLGMFAYQMVLELLRALAEV